jgi:hypothetical protein
MKRKPKIVKYLWMRPGDMADYENLGSSDAFDDALSSIEHSALGDFYTWHRDGLGFDTLSGIDVSMFWGDKYAQLISKLRKKECRAVRQALADGVKHR